SPSQLARDQLGIVDQLDLTGAQHPSTLDAAQDGAVFGDVVARDPDRLGDLLEDLSRGIGHDDADRRRPGVAPRPAVDVHDDLHSRITGYSAASSGSSPGTRGRRRSRTAGL